MWFSESAATIWHGKKREGEKKIEKKNLRKEKKNIYLVKSLSNNFQDSKQYET